jgi:hypothetical protein
MTKRTARSAKSEMVKEFSQTKDVKTSKGFIRAPEVLNIKLLAGRLQSGLHVFWKNKRLRWGLVTLLVIAPIANFVYLLLPEYGFDDYFINIVSIEIPNTLEGEENELFTKKIA